MLIDIGKFLALGTLVGSLAGLTANALGEAAAPNDAAPVSETQFVQKHKPCNADVSEHKVSFVTVEPGVELEVLDWGGTGEPIVLLAGLGDNAHVFDDFAYHFNDRFRVIGITRRGFGKSSQPADGYDIDRRVRDVLAVLDALKIPKAIFIGHSIAGTELNKLGADYPDRVKKLVYLDGLDLGAGGWSVIPQPPASPELSDADVESVQRLAAAQARDDGHRKPLAAVCHSVKTDASGKVVEAVSPPEISQKIIEGLQPADYKKIKAPVLAILNRLSPQYRLAYYGDLDAAEQKQYNESMQALSVWIGGAIDRLRTGVPHARVIELPDGDHYVYITYEPMVVREVRKFLLEEGD
jgi:non-heme chloroperoxidase